MKFRILAVALAAGGTLLAACGGDDDLGATATAPVTAPPATVATTPAPVAPTAAPTVAPSGGDPVAVRLGQSDLGQILTGPDGRTLYGFKQDTEGVSTCTGTCAQAWPPATATPAWTVGPGLDTGIFSTIPHPEAGEQLVAGRWPLYYFAGDAAPGDITGQGSGDVWFAVGIDGRLIESAPADAAATTAPAAPAPAAPVAVGETSLGQVLVDSEGLTLYALTDDDGAETPTCNGACADAWPPVLTDAAPGAVEGVPDGTFSVVTREDGSSQLKAGKWPLYRFAGDAAPGDVNGQGSGDVWFVVAPDGKLIKEAQGISSAPAESEDPYDY